MQSASDRQKLNRVFDSLEADPGLDARQQALLTDLRKLVPRPAGEAPSRVRHAAKGKPVRRRAVARAIAE